MRKKAQVSHPTSGPKSVAVTCSCCHEKHFVNSCIKLKFDKCKHINRALYTMLGEHQNDFYIVCINCANHRFASNENDLRLFTALAINSKVQVYRKSLEDLFNSLHQGWVKFPPVLHDIPSNNLNDDGAVDDYDDTKEPRLTFLRVPDILKGPREPLTADKLPPEAADSLVNNIGLFSQRLFNENAGFLANGTPRPTLRTGENPFSSYARKSKQQQQQEQEY